jgi:hypothetical protein
LHERVDPSKNAACEAPSSNRNYRRDSAHQIRLANNSIDEYRSDLANGANFSVISYSWRIDGLAVVTVNQILSGENLGFILLPILVLHATVLRGEGLFVTWRTLKDGLFWLADSELLIVDVQLYSAIIAVLLCWGAGGFGEVWLTPRSEAGKMHKHRHYL